MKTKFFAFFLVTALILTGCKDEKSVDNLEVVKPEIVDNTFKVILKVLVKKDDAFCLFYSEDGSTNFTSEPIWTNVKGSASEQEVVYTMPEDVLPTQLRIDFGLKKDQEDIILKGVTLQYGDKKRDITGLEIANFFRPDVSKCSFDATTGTIKAVVKDGERQSPSLYPHETILQPELEKLVR